MDNINITKLLGKVKFQFYTPKGKKLGDLGRDGRIKMWENGTDQQVNEDNDLYDYYLNPYKPLIWYHDLENELHCWTQN